VNLSILSGPGYDPAVECGPLDVLAAADLHPTFILLFYVVNGRAWGCLAFPNVETVIVAFDILESHDIEASCYTDFGWWVLVIDADDADYALAILAEHGLGYVLA
jgi:hypothetical protein